MSRKALRRFAQAPSLTHRQPKRACGHDRRFGSSEHSPASAKLPRQGEGTASAASVQRLSSQKRTVVKKQVQDAGGDQAIRQQLLRCTYADVPDDKRMISAK
eukprot:2951320-Prymnesium_polylepis.1